jgi:hypothetical protein
MKSGPGNITYGAQTHMIPFILPGPLQWSTVITTMPPIFKNVLAIMEKQLAIILLVFNYT